MPDIVGKVVLTSAGEQKILSGSLTISEIAIGDSSWSPAKSSIDLQNERIRVPITGAVTQMASGQHRLRATGVFDGAETIDVREFGLFADDGTLVFVHSQAAIIVSKAAGSSFVFSLDVAIPDPGEATIVLTGNNTWALPQASESQKGVVELATDNEASVGTDDTRAITPRNLKKTVEGGFLSARFKSVSVSLTQDVAHDVGVPGRLYARTIPFAFARVVTGSSLALRWGHGVSGIYTDPGTALYVTLANTLRSENEAVALVNSENSFRSFGALFLNKTIIIIQGRDLRDNSQIDFSTSAFEFSLVVFGNAA